MNASIFEFFQKSSVRKIKQLHLPAGKLSESGCWGARIKSGCRPKSNALLAGIATKQVPRVYLDKKETAR